MCDVTLEAFSYVTEADEAKKENKIVKILKAIKEVFTTAVKKIQEIIFSLQDKRIIGFASAIANYTPSEECLKSEITVNNCFSLNSKLMSDLGIDNTQDILEYMVFTLGDVFHADPKNAKFDDKEMRTCSTIANAGKMLNQDVKTTVGDYLASGKNRGLDNVNTGISSFIKKCDRTQKTVNKSIKELDKSISQHAKATGSTSPDEFVIDVTNTQSFLQAYGAAVKSASNEAKNLIAVTMREYAFAKKEGKLTK